MENTKLRDVYELVPREPAMHTPSLVWVLKCKFKNSVPKKNKAPLVPGAITNALVSITATCSSPRHSRPRYHSYRHYLSLPVWDAQGGALHGVAGGYTAPGKGDWVWRLKKCLYELVQVGRTWNEDLNSHIVSEGLAATPKDPAVYVKQNTWDWKVFVGGGF